MAELDDSLALVVSAAEPPAPPTLPVLDAPPVAAS
jgi:hypothetical protein